MEADRAQLSFINQNIRSRFSVMQIVASISVGVLAILALNSIEDSIFLRILISVLLLLSPIVLYLYLLELRNGDRQSAQIIKKVHSELPEVDSPVVNDSIDKLDKLDGKYSSLFDRLRSNFPVSRIFR